MPDDVNIAGVIIYLFIAASMLTSWITCLFACMHALPQKNPRLNPKRMTLAACYSSLFGIFLVMSFEDARQTPFFEDDFLSKLWISFSIPLVIALFLLRRLERPPKNNEKE